MSRSCGWNLRCCYNMLLLSLARAWCTIPVADLPQVWCAGFRRCLFSLLLIVEKPRCGFATGGRRGGHPGPTGNSQVSSGPREETHVAHSAPGCVPPIPSVTRPLGLKFGHRWVYAGRESKSRGTPQIEVKGSVTLRERRCSKVGLKIRVS